jgi:diphthamide synthase (EF-2-diphthine--ammonia ligase)
MPHKICMLWSGGKDSFVSYFAASTALGTLPSDWLFVTFVPRSGGFRCHPLGLLERQSNALRVDHVFAVVDPDDWEASYYHSFRCLRDRWGVERVFSGDILFSSAGLEDYWLLQMLEDIGIEMTLPLAGMYAGPLFDRIEEYGINAVVTGVAEWVNCPRLVGCQISLALLHSSGFYLHPHFDLAGEQGEYHTSVLAAAGSQFASADDVRSSRRRRRIGGVDVALTSSSLLYLSSPRLDLTRWRS